MNQGLSSSMLKGIKNVIKAIYNIMKKIQWFKPY